MTISIHDISEEIYSISHMYRADPDEVEVLICEPYFLAKCLICTDTADFDLSIMLKNDAFRGATLLVKRVEDVFKTDTLTFAIAEELSISAVWDLLISRLNHDG